MFTLLYFAYIILMICVFGGLLTMSFRAAWGIARILFTLVFLPIALIGMLFAGLIRLAFPILVLIGIYTVFRWITD